MKKHDGFGLKAERKALAMGVLYSAKKPVITEKELALGETSDSRIWDKFKNGTVRLAKQAKEKVFPQKYTRAEIADVRSLKKGSKRTVSFKSADQRFYSKIVAISAFVILASFLFTSGILETRTRSITINDNGRIVAADTKEKTVGDFLEKNGIAIGDSDVLELARDTKLENGMEIVIKRALPITIRKGDSTFDVLMLAGTVEEALALSGIELGEYDEVYPSLETYISSSTTIDVIEVTYETTTVEEVLHYKEISQGDGSLDKGTTKVVTEGKNGLQIHTVVTTYKNGKQVSQETTSTQVVEEVVDKVVSIGTSEKGSSVGSVGGKKAAIEPPKAEAPKSSNVDDTGKRTSVPTVNDIHSDSLYEHRQAAAPAASIIEKTVVIDKVTAYTWTGNPTATGTYPRIGTIAADPGRFPYGTKVYVPGYGYGRIEDTGGFRGASYSQFDLYMDSESACINWGRKDNLKVYILKG